MANFVRDVALYKSSSSSFSPDKPYGFRGR